MRSVGRFTPRRVIESPSTTMSPCCTRSRPLTVRISVDLPDPDGPHTTTTSPVSTASSIPRKTCSLPNHLLTPLELDRRRHLFDNHERVARVHGLARLHADLDHGPRR